MEEERTGADVAPQVRASSVAIAVPTVEVAPVSQRFRVELTPGETTIVSWRKLLRDAGGGNGGSTSEVTRPSGAHPALESRISPPVMGEKLMETEGKDGQPLANRFGAVIEKIERLYMGKESSDDEEVFGNAPDDDQYDTDDSFIDDVELNDYFQVDEEKLKHSGFFINRGKLERLERSSSPNMTPKKRRRKDSTKIQSDKAHAHMLTEPVNIGNIKMKAAARNASLVGKKLQSSTTVHHREANQEAKVSKNKSSAISRTDKKMTDPSINLNASSSSKLQNKESSLRADLKDLEKQKDGHTQSRDILNKSRVLGEATSLNNEVYHEKSATSHIVSQCRKPPKDGYENETDASKKIRYRDNNGITELPDLNSPGTASIYPTQAEGEPKQVKEGCIIRPKGTALERAIRDLEKVVTEFRPPQLDLKETNASQAVKKRLPAEIKQRLAKVARLADSQGKITSEQFLDRLMGIVGHLLQPKTLKRHLKEMVELGLSVKQAKTDKFQQIKKEVIEMIKMHVTSSKSKIAEQNTIPSENFQETASDRAQKSRSSIDYAIEDKMCDLYDLYVEGMDEDKGPQARKLYVELAELWPAGCMDNLRIKDAVYRAKERKRALQKQRKIQEVERLKRKRLYRTDEDARLGSQTRVAQDRSAMDLSGQVNASSHKVNSSSGRVSELIQSSNDLDDHYIPKHHDQIRGSIASIASDEGSKALVAIRKKMKRKADANSSADHVHSSSITSSRQTDVKDKSQRASKANNDGIPQIIALPSLGFQAPKQT